jgi:limonene-1,2-epoxide hydrolase
MIASNSETVRRFCQSLTSGDMTLAVRHLSNDVYYHNMPWEPLRGARAVQEFLQPFVDGTHCTLTSMEIHHQVAEGDTVMNARTEIWERRGVRVALPVAGVFVLRENLIVRWCDYWDLATFKPILDALAQ